MTYRIRTLTVLALTALIVPAPISAASCRLCGLLPDSWTPELQNSTLFLEADLVDQNENWHGGASAPAADNPDKDIIAAMVVPGADFAFADGWSARIEVPFVDQTYRGEADGTVRSFRHAALGDIRLSVSYATDDGAFGVSLGLKLPTGDAGYGSFARDTQIGTGSTDALFAISTGGALAADWTWSADIAWAKPLASRDGFIPGSEVAAAVSVAYAGWNAGGVRVTPSLQGSAASRTKDGGSFSDPANTGCGRIALSPGITLDMNAWTLAGAVDVTVHQWVRGDQLVARQQFKLVLSYRLDS